MRGEIVVCKEVIGNQLERVVWKDTDALIFIHTEDLFFRT
jgi:hypothetical protein